MVRLFHSTFTPLLVLFLLFSTTAFSLVPATDDLGQADSSVAVSMPSEVDTSMVYQVVDTYAEFPGGDKAMQRFIYQNLTYPVVARNKNIQGRVFVMFTVGTDGSLCDIKVSQHNNPHPFLQAEALRLVKSMPKWTPAKVKGVNVKVSYTIPINFALK